MLVLLALLVLPVKAREAGEAGEAQEAGEAEQARKAEPARFFGLTKTNPKKKLVSGYISGYISLSCKKPITELKKKCKKQQKNWLQTGYSFHFWLHLFHRKKSITT